MQVLESQGPAPTSKTVGLWLYNGLDCCVTLEVFQAIYPQLDEITRPIYEHAIALQAPILEMQLRGFRIDESARGPVAAAYERDLTIVEASLDEILRDGLGIENFNAGSWQQKGYLFYEVLGLPHVRKAGRITTNRSALEKFRSNFHAEPFVNHILLIMDLRKKLGVLRTPVDRDGRMRTSFNIAGTDTGRLSSYVSSFGSGTNLQNITGLLRKIFCADPGKKLAYVDLEQAESRMVGAIVWNVFHDGTYLDFCESGDLHTGVAMMTFPDLAWSGAVITLADVLHQLHDPAALKINKDVAKQIYYREFSYRESCKRLGHGTSYFGQPPQMAKETRIHIDLVKEFQYKFFKNFAGIKKWHEYVRVKLIKDGWMTSLMGRRRWFFGRRYDLDTLRAAIAYDPQSSIADYMNKGMLRVWREEPRAELILQVHDAIVFQYDESLENEIVPRVMKLLQIEVELLHDRKLIIPTEAFVGFNWGYKTDKNPDGLVKFDGNDTRVRGKPVAVLDRKFY